MKGSFTKGAAQAVRLCLAVFAMLLPLEAALAVCSPALSTDSFIQHDLSNSYCELCATGQVRVRVTNPRDDNDDLSNIVVTENLGSSGLTYVPGSTAFVGTNVAAPAAFNPVVSGPNGSILTWTFPAGFVLQGNSGGAGNKEAIEIRYQVRRATGLNQEGLVTANRTITGSVLFTASCDAGSPYTDTTVDELPIRQPVPRVTKLGRNTDAGQASNSYSGTVYGNINDDVIWRIQVQNQGLAGLQDLRIDDVMGTGNFLVNYLCPNEATASAITSNNGIRPGGSPCLTVPAGNSLLNFAVDDPFGNPSNDEPGAYVDVPANNSGYLYFVGKTTTSCVGPRTNTVSDVQWGCEVDAPDGGITVPASTGGSIPGYRTTHSANLSTVVTNSGLTVTQNLTGTNTSQPVGSKGTVTLIFRNQTGGTVKNINFTDTLPPEYVVDSTFTPTVAMAPAYGNAYPGMTNQITWTNPAAGTFPLTTTNPALPLSNTAPRFSLTSSTVHVNYPDQRNLMRHGDVLTVTFRIVLIKPQNYDKVANLDVRVEAPNSTPPGTDPTNNTPSLTNRLDVDFEQFCNPGIIQRPAQMVRSNIPVSPEDLDVDIVGSELIFILTNNPAQRLPLTVALTNNGGHDARDFSAFVTFGQSMSVVTVPSGCSVTSNPPALPPWRIPVTLPATATVYRCSQPVIGPGSTVLYNFEVIKNAAAGIDDDLTFRADVIGEITLSNGTPLWFPTPTARADGVTDRANNYSLDGIRARVIGFNLLKSQLGVCTENNPPPASPDNLIQIGEDCSFHIDTGGWFGFQTPGFTYIAVQKIQVVDQLPAGQGFISSTDPFATGTTSAVKGISRNPLTLAPLDEGWFDWTFNQNVATERITVKDEWFRVNATTRLMNNPIDTVAAPNQHAALSTNTLNSTFQAVFFNNVTNMEEVYNLGDTTVGYPQVAVRRVSLTVTEPNILVTKEVCNESLHGVGTACNAFVPATAEGNAQNTYVYRITLTNQATSSGVTRAPAYDVTATDVLDPSDLAYVVPFATDGLDNDGDGLIDEADEGSISDNVVNNGTPATITFSHTDSAPLLRINPGQSVTLMYRVDFDDTAAPRQTFANRVTATYDSLTGPFGNQDAPQRPNSDRGGARVYTSLPATATVQIIPVLVQPKSITRLSNSVLAGSPQPVSIGEEIEYQLVTQIPVSQLRSFVIRDELPAGVRCTDAPIVNLDAPPYSAAGFSPGGSFTPTCTDNLVEWNFGDQQVTNAPGPLYDFAIRFIARVENTAVTNNGGVIRNGGTATVATATYIDQSNATVVLNFAEVAVVVREPAIALTKAFGVASADAADEITVTVTATNTGTATAYGLRVLDDLTTVPATKLTYVPGSVAGAQPPDTVDLSIPNRPIFRWNPLNPNFAIAPGATRSFTFRVSVDGNVQPQEVLDNTLQADWTSLPSQNTALNSGGAIGVDGSATGMRNGDVLVAGVDAINDYETTAVATATVPPISLSKTDLSPAVIPAIGAHKNFQIEIRLPEGESHNVVATDNLAATGISYVLANNAGFDITYTFIGITSINGAAPSEAAFLAFPADNTSGNAVWNIGTVVTASENDAATNALSPVIRINYFARVNNDLVTNVGNTLQNSVTLNYSHGESGAPQTLTGTTPAVSVVEPLLVLAKTVSNVTAPGQPPVAGDVLEYQVTATNTGNSTAFDTNFDDILPAGTVLFAGFTPTASIGGTPVAGFVPTPANAPVGPLIWGRGNGDGSLDIPAGQTLALTYHTLVQVVIDPTGLIGNSITADWTSLNDTSPDERTGDGCPNITQPNDYCAGPVTATTTGARPVVAFEKTVINVTTGQNPGINAAPGNTLRYHIEVRNLGPAVTNFSLVDEVDRLNNPTAMFVPGTLTLISALPPGAVNLTNPTGGAKGTGLVDIRNLSLGAVGSPTANLMFEFEIQLVPVILHNSVVLNQAQMLIAGLVLQKSDDPNIVGTEDPTSTVILSAPAFRVQKTSQDLTGDPNILLPGETLRYTITIKNIGTENATGVTLRDLIPANTTYVANSTTLNGAPLADPSAGVSPLQTDILINAPEDTTPGALRADATATTTNVATIVFDVVINANVINGTIISNQGFVNGFGSGSPTVPFAEKPSDDPATPVADDPTRNVVGNLPLLYTLKTVQLQVDNGSPGIVDPGDVLRYTFTINNSGALPATGATLTDALPNDTTYVANSLQLNGQPVAGPFPLATGLPISSANLTPPLPAAGAGTLSPGGTATVIFDAQVNALTPTGTIISNQGAVGSNELPPQLTDADGNPTNGYQPTQVVVGNAQRLTMTKQVAVVGGGVALVGGQLEYVVRVTNIGAVPVTSVVITDTLPVSLIVPPRFVVSYVAGSAMMNSSTTGVTVAGSTITADYSTPYGDLAPGGTVELRFRIQIDAGIPGATITNTATVTWDTPTQTASASASIDIGGAAGSAALNGRAWHDANFNNLFDGTEQPLVGWDVQVYANGLLVASVLTDTNGQYRVLGLAPYSTTNIPYEIRFRAPGAGVGTASLGLANHDATLFPLMVDGPQRIANIEAGSGSNIQNLDMPIDPDGVVYNSVLRTPTAGATLTLLLASTQAALPSSCFDDGAQQNQVTLGQGYYKFDLNFSSPACPSGADYLIRVTPPVTGYGPAPSAIIPPATSATSASYSVATCPADAVATPAGYCEAQTSEFAPATSVPPQTAGTIYYLNVNLDNGSVPGHSQLFNNHIPLDPDLGAAMAISKTSPLINVIRGQLVPYTITVKNTLGATLPFLSIVDTFPPGFKYVADSARFDDVPSEPAKTTRQISWDNLTLAGDSQHVIKLLLIVGAGVGDAEYINRAQVMSSATGGAASGVATATVRVTPDPTFDCTDIIGKVFDDTNTNGYQDKDEPGLPGVRIVSARGLIATTDKYGRYHITCAVVPNEDRGSNFILKLDDRTLPSGYRLTTENPLVLRATRGKMLKFNFGATLHRIVRLDISDAVFEPDTTDMRPQWKPRTGLLMSELRKAPAILRVTYLADVEDTGIVTRRLKSVKQALIELWKEERHSYELTIETEIYWRRGGPPDSKALAP